MRLTCVRLTPPPSVCVLLPSGSISALASRVLKRLEHDSITSLLQVQPERHVAFTPALNVGNWTLRLLQPVTNQSTNQLRRADRSRLLREAVSFMLSSQPSAQNCPTSVRRGDEPKISRVCFPKAFPRESSGGGSHLLREQFLR